MTIRMGAIAVALLAALATIKFGSQTRENCRSLPRRKLL
jgi:hypothetical protein